MDQFSKYIIRKLFLEISIVYKYQTAFKKGGQMINGSYKILLMKTKNFHSDMITKVLIMCLKYSLDIESRTQKNFRTSITVTKF